MATEKDDWAFMKIGHPFPSNPVRVMGENNLYVALGYKYGVPIFGVGRNNGGVVECSFPWAGRELTKRENLDGDIQILAYIGNCNYFEWVTLKESKQRENLQMVRCGGNAPIFMMEGSQLGNLLIRNETASFIKDGKEQKIVGNPVLDMLVICRNETSVILHTQVFYRSDEICWIDVNEFDKVPPGLFPSGANDGTFIALWFKDNQAVIGRCWSKDGKLAASFGYKGKEFKENIGTFQVLQFTGEDTDYNLNWRALNIAWLDGWSPVHVMNESPCMVKVMDGTKKLGMVNLDMERASVVQHGRESIIKGPQVQNFDVLCRKALPDLYMEETQDSQSTPEVSENLETADDLEESKVSQLPSKNSGYVQQVTLEAEPTRETSEPQSTPEIEEICEIEESLPSPELEAMVCTDLEQPQEEAKETTAYQQISSEEKESASCEIKEPESKLQESETSGAEVAHLEQEPLPEAKKLQAGSEIQGATEGEVQEARDSLSNSELQLTPEIEEICETKELLPSPELEIMQKADMEQPKEGTKESEKSNAVYLEQEPLPEARKVQAGSEIQGATEEEVQEARDSLSNSELQLTPEIEEICETKELLPSPELEIMQKADMEQPKEGTKESEKSNAVYLEQEPLPEARKVQAGSEIQGATEEEVQEARDSLSNSELQLTPEIEEICETKELLPSPELEIMQKADMEQPKEGTKESEKSNAVYLEQEPLPEARKVQAGSEIQGATEEEVQEARDSLTNSELQLTPEIEEICETKEVLPSPELEIMQKADMEQPKEGTKESEKSNAVYLEQEALPGNRKVHASSEIQGATEGEVQEARDSLSNSELQLTPEIEEICETKELLPSPELEIMQKADMEQPKEGTKESEKSNAVYLEQEALPGNQKVHASSEIQGATEGEVQEARDSLSNSELQLTPEIEEICETKELLPSPELEIMQKADMELPKEGTKESEKSNVVYLEQEAPPGNIKVHASSEIQRTTEMDEGAGLEVSEVDVVQAPKDTQQQPISEEKENVQVADLENAMDMEKGEDFKKPSDSQLQTENAYSLEETNKTKPIWIYLAALGLALLLLLIGSQAHRSNEEDL